MMIPEASHPLWKLLSMSVVCGTLILMLKYNYVSGWTSQDIVTVLAVLAGQGTVQAASMLIGGKHS